MAYKAQVWIDYDENKSETINIENGAVVTSERMNKLEQGVVSNYNDLNKRQEDLDEEIKNTQSGFLGDFPNESELNKKYPKGAKGYATATVQKVTCRFVWDGKRWENKGPFNGMGIPNDSIESKKVKSKQINERKTTFYHDENNLFNEKSPEIQYSKGFKDNTNIVVDDDKLNITHLIKNNGKSIIYILDSGQEVERPNFFKIASFKGTEWISTQYFKSNPVNLPAESDGFYVHYDKDVTSLEILNDLPTFRSSTLGYQSIGIDKLDFFDISENLLDISAEGTIVGKGFSGSTNTIVESDPHSITPFIEVFQGKRAVFLTIDNQLAVTPAHYKIAEYDKNQNWLRTTIMYAHYVNILDNTKFMRIHYNRYDSNQMISYDHFKNYKKYERSVLKRELLPENKPALINMNFTSYGDSLTFRNKWQPYLLSKFELNLTNLGIGSTTVAYVAEHESQYPCLLNQNRLNNLMLSNPDILTINGGANDAHRYVKIGDNSEFKKSLDDKDKTTFKGAFSYLIEYLLQWKPTLKIILITIPKVDRVKYTFNYQDFNNAIYEIANEYGLPVADWNRECGYSHVNIDSYTIDGLHHNEDGGKRAAEVVMKQLDVMRT